MQKLHDSGNVNCVLNFKKIILFINLTKFVPKSFEKTSATYTRVY